MRQKRPHENHNLRVFVYKNRLGKGFRVKMLKSIGTTDIGIVSAFNFLIEKGTLIFLVICFPKKKKTGGTLFTPGTKSYRINEVGPQCFFISWFFLAKFRHFSTKNLVFFYWQV
jgi:hypothetical protein